MTGMGPDPLATLGIPDFFERRSTDGARMASCPECEFDEIDTEDLEEGDRLSCPECGKGLVMVGSDELDVADEEDDDDDEDLEDEEEDEDGDDDDDDLDDDDEDEEEFDE